MAAAGSLPTGEGKSEIHRASDYAGGEWRIGVQRHTEAHGPLPSDMTTAGRARHPAVESRCGRASGSGGALQLLGAFAVVAAALLDPLHAAIGVGRLVGVVLVDAGVHPRLAGRLLGVFRIDRIRVDC